MSKKSRTRYRYVISAYNGTDHVHTETVTATGLARAIYNFLAANVWLNDVDLTSVRQHGSRRAIDKRLRKSELRKEQADYIAKNSAVYDGLNRID